MKSFLKDSLSLLVGSLLFAIGICVFASPANLLTGGAGGAAMIINSLTGLAVGTGILIINIPLFISALIICGRGYSVKVLYSTAVFSTVIDLFELVFKIKYTGNLFVSAVFGGIFTGVSMYILLRRALVTGGSDLLAFLINKKNPKKTLGLMIFIIDATVVILGAIIYKSLYTAIFSVVLIAIMSAIVETGLRRENDKLFKRDNRP